MLKAIILLISVVSMTSALPWIWPGFPYYQGYNGYNGYYPHHGYHNYGAYPIPHGQARLIYYGQFKGTCAGAPDGLYYVDEYNFAYCSNGQKTIQPCAEGSANPALAHFKSGGYYGFYDFCAVNLVALGYNRQPAYLDSKPEVHAELAGYEIVNDNKEGGHYVVEDSYVVEETHGADGYQDEKAGYNTYEEPKKAEHYYGEKSYEEKPVKVAY